MKINCYLCRTGSKLGISPLMLAAMNGHTSTVKLLLDMGSDINAQVGAYVTYGIGNQHEYMRVHVHVHVCTCVHVQ